MTRREALTLVREMIKPLVKDPDAGEEKDYEAMEEALGDLLEGDLDHLFLGDFLDSEVG